MPSNNVSTPFVKDGWDWPFIIYAGTVWLRRTEEEIWKMTPRKLQALLLVHYDIKRQENGKESQRDKQETVGFIDTIPGW